MSKRKTNAPRAQGASRIELLNKAKSSLEFAIDNLECNARMFEQMGTLFQAISQHEKTGLFGKTLAELGWYLGHDQSAGVECQKDSALRDIKALDDMFAAADGEVA